MGGPGGGADTEMIAYLKELVKNGELHYIVLGGGMGGVGGRGGSDSVSSEVTAWVREHGTAVEASEYGGASSAGSGSQTDQNTQALYRLDASDVN